LPVLPGNGPFYAAKVFVLLSFHAAKVPVFLADIYTDL